MKKPSKLSRTLFVTLVTAGAVFTSLVSQAQIVSLNLTEFATDVQQIDADETYGVPGLGSVVGGWVNLNQTLNATDLAFSDGSSSTVDVNLTAPNGWGSAAAGANDTPLKGFIDDYTATVNPAYLTLSQLNASFPLGYFAVVYLSGFNLNDGASISDGTSTFYYQPVNFAAGTWDGTLVQTTTTTDLGSGNAPVAQYALFGSPSSPLTTDSVTFTLDTLYGGGSGLGGVQIVGVPEPSVAMTLLLGAGMISWARRRRTA
jgi:hypothetical protein